MGGFEGGDEGGFWEVDENSSLYGTSKTSTEIKYQVFHDNVSYTIKANGFNEIITLFPCELDELTVEGYTTNIISKAYKTLVDFTDDMEIEEFFHHYKVIIDGGDKEINEALLGALFILLTKDVCNLVLNNKELEEIAVTIGADITQLL